MSTNGTRHHLAIDVEEYFQVSAFESAVPRAYWNNFQSRVAGSEGYRHDSSLFPTHRPVYGCPSAKRVPHVVDLPLANRLGPSLARRLP